MGLGNRVSPGAHVKLAEHIEKTDGVLGGRTRLAGTRLSTRLIARTAHHHGAGRVRQFWPDVTVDQIRAAVEWEREHPSPPESWDEADEGERAWVLRTLREHQASLTDETLRQLVELAVDELEGV